MILSSTETCGNKLEVLEHKADARTQLIKARAAAVDIDTIKQDLPFSIGSGAVNRANQRRFSRAGWPADHHHFARLHFRTQVVGTGTRRTIC